MKNQQKNCRARQIAQNHHFQLYLVHREVHREVHRAREEHRAWEEQMEVHGGLRSSTSTMEDYINTCKSQGRSGCSWSPWNLNMAEQGGIFHHNTTNPTGLYWSQVGNRQPGSQPARRLPSVGQELWAQRNLYWVQSSQLP